MFQRFNRLADLYLNALSWFVTSRKAKTYLKLHPPIYIESRCRHHDRFEMICLPDFRFSILDLCLTFILLGFSWEGSLFCSNDFVFFIAVFIYNIPLWRIFYFSYLCYFWKSQTQPITSSSIYFRIFI